jgi:hypothetical protein
MKRPPGPKAREGSRVGRVGQPTRSPITRTLVCTGARFRTRGTPSRVGSPRLTIRDGSPYTDQSGGPLSRAGGLILGRDQDAEAGERGFLGDAQSGCGAMSEQI